MSVVRIIRQDLENRSQSETGRNCAPWGSVPRILLITHEALLQSALLKVSDEIAVSSAALLLRAAPASTGLSAWGTFDTDHAITCRRIVCRTGLQPDRVVGIEVTGHALYGRRDAALLLLHSRCPLPARPHAILGIQSALSNIAIRCWWQLLWRRLCHRHLAIVARLSAVWWRLRRVATIWRVHDIVAIHGGSLLRMAALMMVLGSHGGIRILGCRVGLCLCCLGSLFA